MKDNRGFSLVELLVTITIAGILGSVLMMSLSSLFSTEASGTAKNINSYLSKAKVQSMSRAGQVCIVLYRRTNGRTIGEYYENDVLVSTEELGSRHGALSYTDDGGNTVRLDSPSARLYLSFDRTTGALKTIGEAASAAGVSLSNSAHCRKITIETDTRRFEITLVPSTGKHSLAGG